MPFNLTPSGPSLNTLTGLQPDPQRVGDRTLEAQLGRDSGLKLNQMTGGFRSSTADVIATARGMAREDTNPMGPPPIPPPAAGAAPAMLPQGPGMAEYNVVSPYETGPGVYTGDIHPIKTNSAGQRVIDIDTPNIIKTPKKSSPWLWLALIGAGVYFAS